MNNESRQLSLPPGLKVEKKFPSKGGPKLLNGVFRIHLRYTASEILSFVVCHCQGFSISIVSSGQLELIITKQCTT